MLTKKEVEEVRKALNNSKRPFFLFDDDPDGLASFLQLYEYVKRGKGMVVKARPQITDFFAEKANSYGADAIFIVDIAIVDQEFLDSVNSPVYWIDHHDPLDRENVNYYNPRKKNKSKNIPASVLCHQITQGSLWQATVGAIGDWHMPEYAKEFTEKYPKILPKNIKTVEEALYKSKLGELIKIFSFILKGPTRSVYENIKVMTRIEEPEELLEQTSNRGRFIAKRCKPIQKEYDSLLKRALKEKPDQGVFVFTYEQDRLSLTKDLANEILYRVPNTIIVFGRRKSGEVRCSLRGNHLNLKKALEKALEGVRGRGGGHEHACGAAIQEEDFEKFVNKLKTLSK